MRLTRGVSLALCCFIAASCLISSSTAAHPGNRRALRSSLDRDELLIQFKTAAASGDLELTQHIQRKLLKIDEEMQKHNSRRQMLQITVDCSDTTLDLLPCADFGCVSGSGSVLRRGPTGDIRCVTPAPPPEGVDVSNFIYFLPYDYDALWDTDADNVLSAASTTSVTSNTNEFTSSDGTIGYNSRIEDNTNTRAVPFPFLGLRADDSTRIDLFKTEFAVGTDPQQPVTFTDTTNAGLDTSAVIGAYLPGVTATAREPETPGGSEDNVVFTIENLNALGGVLGH